MTQIDKEIEDAMGAVGTWKGSSDRMWQKVEGEIRRRQNRGRWMRTWAPVAVAAAALVVALGVKPGVDLLTRHPQGEIGGAPHETPSQPPAVIPQPLPPDVIKKLPGTDQEHRVPGIQLTLPDYLGAVTTIVLGQVVSVQDTDVPCVDPHTNANCEPFPAKVFTIQTRRVYKGDPDQSFTLRQLVPSDRFFDPDGKADPLMTVGSTYLFFFHSRGDFLLEDRLELGSDNRLIALTHTSPVLQPLVGLTPDQAAATLRHP